MCQDASDYVGLIKTSAATETLCSLRRDTAHRIAVSFNESGELLRVCGHFFGPDRVSGDSPGGNGSDSIYGVGLLLSIAGQLVDGAVDLFASNRRYAAASLLRQLVEVEYLAWAFEHRDNDAANWLRSDKSLRLQMFAPHKLRKAADGRFRGQDYGHHCELGGHPTPQAASLFAEDGVVAELLMADMIGHCERTWKHLVAWSNSEPITATVFAKHRRELQSCISAWRDVDPLAHLPLPPSDAGDPDSRER